MGFYEEKFNQINTLKYLMTLGARSGNDKVYKIKLEQVFKEIEEYKTEDRELISLTVEELKQYNGTEGKQAYVAVDGSIYDLSKVSQEIAMAHKDLPLGEDVSEIFANCHMGQVSLLKKLPLVGKIIPIRDLIEFTPEELAKYDGKNGSKAYVAINGIVYDITDFPLLKLPPHTSYPLGVDLSGEFQVCHGTNTKILQKIPIIGKLVKNRDDNKFTVEELAKYNGKDGNKGYIAIDGVVYDVSNLQVLNKPPHNKLNLGTDLTATFKQCHNNQYELLKDVPKVGVLIQESRTKVGGRERNSRDILVGQSNRFL